MRKISILLLLSGLSTSLLKAQTDSLQKPKDTTKVFTTVQIEAQFPGGTAAWSKYLQTNLNADLGAKYVKVKTGQTVIVTAVVSFLVDKEGNIKEVQVLNPDEIHPKLAKEAIRVIRDGPKWIPAMQNGKPVIYRQKQKISWAVTGD